MLSTSSSGRDSQRMRTHGSQRALSKSTPTFYRADRLVAAVIPTVDSQYVKILRAKFIGKGWL